MPLDGIASAACSTVFVTLPFHARQALAWANTSTGGVGIYLGSQEAMGAQTELFKLALLELVISPNPYTAAHTAGQYRSALYPLFLMWYAIGRPHTMVILDLTAFPVADVRLHRKPHGILTVELYVASRPGYCGTLQPNPRPRNRHSDCM